MRLEIRCPLILFVTGGIQLLLHGRKEVLQGQDRSGVLQRVGLVEGSH